MPDRAIRYLAKKTETRGFWIVIIPLILFLVYLVAEQRAEKKAQRSQSYESRTEGK